MEKKTHFVSGVLRCVQNASSVADIAKRMTIIHADSTQYVSSLGAFNIYFQKDSTMNHANVDFDQIPFVHIISEPSQRPHVVLLDPMYPSPANVRKQALPKKGMQYLR